jgi:hypothetical protein
MSKYTYREHFAHYARAADARPENAGGIQVQAPTYSLFPVCNMAQIGGRQLSAIRVRHVIPTIGQNVRAVYCIITLMSISQPSASDHNPTAPSLDRDTHQVPRLKIYAKRNAFWAASA